MNEVTTKRLEYWATSNQETGVSIYADSKPNALNSDTLVMLAREKFLRQASKFPVLISRRLYKLLQEYQKLFILSMSRKKCQPTAIAAELMKVISYPDYIFNQKMKLSKDKGHLTFSYPITIAIKDAKDDKPPFAISYVEVNIYFTSTSIDVKSNVGWFGFEAHGLDRFIRRIENDPKQIITLLSGNSNTKNADFFHDLNQNAIPIAFSLDNDTEKLAYAPLQKFLVNIPDSVIPNILIDKNQTTSVHQLLTNIVAGKVTEHPIFLSKTLLPESYLSSRQKTFSNYFISEIPLDNFFTSFENL